MPARLSKFVIPATCKEYAHPWSDSCVSTTAGLGLQAVQDSLRIYSTLYFIALMTKGRIPNITDFKNTLSSIIQSTVFLSWSAFAYSMFICIFRRMLGHFNVFTVSFVPSFFSSLTAIILERPSRHTLLCLYVTNIATEALFRMAVSRGYVSVIPYGEIYIFAAGMAILLYFFRNKTNNHDSIYRIIRLALGPYEEKGYVQRVPESVDPSDHNRKPSGSKSKNPSKSKFNLIWKALEVYKQLITKAKALGGKHSSCPHPNSCIHDVLAGGLKMFSLGFCAQIGVKLIFQMKTLMQRPKQFKEILFRKGTLNLAYFLGGFTSLYQLVSCTLRRVRNEDSPKHAVIAGLIASTAFAMYPDNTIALYVFWKALQLLWNSGVENGKVPEMKWFVILLYSFSTAVLFHAAIVEPQNLRSSYWTFLYNLSGGRIAVMSRIPIDQFGLETSKQLQQVLKKTRTHDRHIYTF